MIILLFVLELVLNLLMALIGMWVLHTTGLPILETISFWQTFGIIIFINIATMGSRVQHN